jgi:hypothetical protein
MESNNEVKTECDTYPWAVPISAYIINKHNNKAAFADAQDVKPQQVTKWVNMKCIVVDGVLYSPRRELKAQYDMMINKINGDK